MNSEKLSAVLEAIARPDNDASLPDEASLRAIKMRVARIVSSAGMMAPPTSKPTPLPELRAIGAPRHLNWNGLKTFPVLLGEVRSNQREWEVQTNQNRFFLLSNLDSGAADVIAPIDHGRRMPVLDPSGSGTPPDESNAVLAIIGVLPYDLMRWFTPQQVQGRLAVTAFDYDMTTNTARVDVAGGPGHPPAPAQRVVARSLPSTPDVDAAAPAVRWPAEIRKGEGAAVHVELKMPRERVALIESPGTEPALAATLMMLQLDKSPVMMHVRAAVKQANGAVTSAFDVEFNGSSTRLMGTGDWVGYVVVGDTVAGPYPFSVSVP